MKYLTLYAYVFTVLITTACTGFFVDPHEAELQAAYERSQTIITEARRTLDNSHLSEVYSQNVMETVEREFVIEKELAKEDPILMGEESETDWVHVLEYNPPNAIIEVKYFFRAYTYNRKTGEIKYYDQPRRYWRTIRVKMLQEDGVWKLDEVLEIVDWSG